jgi:hypothetical protein
MSVRYTPQDISLIADALRAGIEKWQGMVDGCDGTEAATHPLVEIMRGQITRAIAIKEQFEDAESVVLL